MLGGSTSLAQPGGPTAWHKIWRQPHPPDFSAPPKASVFVFVCICAWVREKKKAKQKYKEKKRKEKERIKVLIVKHLVVPGGNESRVISEIIDGDVTEVHFPAAH